MTKTKNTKAKAPAKAKATPDIAPPAARKPAEVAKPVATAKSAAPKPPEPVAPTPAEPALPRIRLELSQPGAHTVAIAGSFNAWQPEQANTNGNGAWVKELTIGPGRYEYMFVVDGQWLPDPNAKEFAPNPFGGQNSVLVIDA